jgi:hypothetical protein
MSSPGANSSVKIAPPPREIEREPLVLNNRSLGWISDQIAGIIEGKTPTWWWVTMLISFPVMLMCFVMIGYLISTGVGVWGLNHPIAWGWAIVNFVFWIGIGHAGNADFRCSVPSETEVANFH